MNKILSQTKNFIFKQQTSMLSSTLILAGMMILSRISGFFRFRIIGGYFNTQELDIFYAAFRIPDLVFEILINGALSTAFIPFFIEYQKNTTNRHIIISSIINSVSLLLFVMIIILIICIPILMPVIVPKFDSAQIGKLIFYSRILLLGQLPFLVLGNFLTAISQAKKSFLIPALAPILYNVAIVIYTVFFSSTMHLLAPILGVVFGAIIFFIIQLPVFYFADFKYSLVLKHFNETLRFFKSALPRIMTIIVAQIDATVDLTLANLLGSGSYTVFYLAQRLQLLPVSVFGMAFGQASLPYLSVLYQEKKYSEFKNVIVTSILNIFYFTIPASMFMIIARTPIVRLFFGAEKFDWNSTVMTAITLSYFALSLPLHSIYYFITRCFYSIFDTKTPFYISGISIIVSAILSIFLTLILRLPVWSLALSFSVTMSLRTLVLLAVLYIKINGYNIFTLAKETIKICIATFNTTILTYFLMRLLDGLIFDTSRTINVFMLIVVGFLFFSFVFLFFSWLFGVKEAYIITRMFIKIKEYQKKLVEVYKGVEFGSE